MKSVWMKLLSAVQSFRVAHAGNVAITFAFATIPIIIGIGSAIDYSKANQVKVAMQSALDSTALMISKEAAKDSTDGTLQTKASSYFSAMFKQPLSSGFSITANYYADGGTRVVINGSANVATSFLGLIGVNNITVSSSSTVRWGSSRLRVALVLDNTGSMADSGKITALKTATANLLTQLRNAAQSNGDVYVSIIPFVKDVNLDSSNWNSDYIYWGTAGTQDAASPNETDNTSWDANNGSCQDQGGTVLGTSSSYKSRSSCRTHSSCSIPGYTSQSSCTAAGSCSLSGYSTQSGCTGAGTCSLSSYTSQSTCTAAGTCSISGHNSQSSCTSAGACSLSGYNSQSSCTSAGVCSKSQYTTSSKCSQHGGTWTAGQWTTGTWTAATWTATPGTWTGGVWSTATTKWVPNDHSTWNGCVTDRGYPASPSYLTVSGSNKSGPDTTYNFDTNAAAVDLVTPRMSSLYAAEQYSSCPQAAMALSYDWTTMNQLVTNMSPNGNTNQAIGLQLGWLSLVGGGPFTVPAMDPNYQYTQVIILLTDGLNTQNRWTSTQSSIDTREQTTCNNINAAGITLYTIQVNTGNDPTSTLLQNCAGTAATATTAAVYPDPSKFFLLTSADAIVTTFQSIGTKLSNLYVAQ
jgi:Flp pilus assembly protein TadG